ncbi:hypothetical protein IJ541_05755 [bacterium]|nr:hypothetical protein [bacterium]
MDINNNRYTYSPIKFGTRLNTASVLESTSIKIFHNDGIAGFKEVYDAFNDKPMRGIGNKGYKYYVEIIGAKIMEKYPEIAKATEELKEIYKNNPYLKKQEIAKKIQPIIDRFGETIDIVL